MKDEPSSRGALLLAIFIIVLLVAALWMISHPVRAHDHLRRPGLTEWMGTLHAKNKTWCCNGSDDDPIDDWETKGGGYRVKFRGQWFDVPEGSIIDGPNKSDGALLWMNKGYSGFSVRCFMPGVMG